MCTSLARLTLLSPEGPQLMDLFLMPLLERQAIVSMRECDPRGEGHLNPFALSVPI